MFDDTIIPCTESLDQIKKVIDFREFEKKNIEIELDALNGYAAAIVSGFDDYGLYADLHGIWGEPKDEKAEETINFILKMFFGDNAKKIKFVSVINLNYGMAMELEFFVGEKKYQIQVPRFKSANMKNWKDCIFMLYEYDASNVWMFVLKDYRYTIFKKAVNEYVFGGKNDSTQII